MIKPKPNYLYRQIRLFTSNPSNHNNATKWNLQLRELSKQNNFTKALQIYQQILRSSNTLPNSFTFPFILKSCASLSLLSTGQQVHCHVIRTGSHSDTFVTTSLISFYCKTSGIDNARKVFDEMAEKDRPMICYNALIAGYAAECRVVEAVLLFNAMRVMGVCYDAVTMLGLLPVCGVPERFRLGMVLHGFSVRCGLVNDVAVGNCLLTMYIRCGSVDCARRLFCEMPEKGLISWNAMINGYAQSGFSSHVLDLYKEMGRLGIRPNEVTLLGVLSCCSYLGARSLGYEVEKKIEELGYGSNVFLKNSLINMHARCGNLVKARAVFDEMTDRSLVTWTGMIGGYGLHGQGETAVELFDEMIKSGIQPDGTVFVSVLAACSHAGLPEKGLDYFYSMERRYGLQPEREHYGCMVDLLGRAGRLREAHELISSMPMKPDAAVWGALLGACKIHKNADLAELAFQRAVEIEPTNVGYYALLSNIYLDAGDMDGVRRIRVMMRGLKVRKDPGYSYVEFDGRTHMFVAGDTSHPEANEIHKMLEKLEYSIKDLTREGELSSSCRLHSERLAIAFAILKTMPGTEIVIIKNLRVCEDCHVFIKLVSKIVDRHFVIRDASRFHHFKHGSCSCKDYW